MKLTGLLSHHETFLAAARPAATRPISNMKTNGCTRLQFEAKSQKRQVLLTAEDDGMGQVGVRSIVQGAAVCKGK
jgi:hypothetical protein